MAARKKTAKKTSRVRSALSSIYKRMASVGQAGLARVRKMRNRTGPDHLVADEEDFAYIEKEAHDILAAIARLRARDAGEYMPEEAFYGPTAPSEATEFDRPAIDEEVPETQRAIQGRVQWAEQPDMMGSLQSVEGILNLRQIAEEQGDHRMVETCNAALDGDPLAIADCQSRMQNMTRGRRGRRNRAGDPFKVEPTHKRTRALGVPLRAKDQPKKAKVKLTMTEKQIIDAMARALFVDAWARRQEEAGKRFRPGVDLMDQAPGTNKAAKVAAADLAKTIERRNSKSLEDLFRDAVAAGGEDNSDKFGHYLAMQSLGHGVSWFDDNPEFPLDLPLIEFWY